ncbi:cysteine desulfurase family protein [Flavobacterium paronense]|uniref:cysteine desulfurase n=1 Tax=Flavobacterium paronense TaxID=1392775 RepID=A0ABV5GB30_9FLAO|nr:cysteine desulfurase family protein [Flavobacterium paronense]MDN3676824.1 cysteine desulfurase family protein [Flavobacterium paronense]
MKKIYLDNAATTPIRQEVIDEMIKVMQSEYGNPSSTHSIGRSAKAIIETSRKTIAKYLHCNAQEIVFTSTATEATNWILRSAVKDFGVKRIITSKVEHHATLYTVKALQEEFGVAVEFVNVSHDGTLDYAQLSVLLSNDVKTIVSLMHVNNETGVVNDIQRIGMMCHENKALFHCDTVQSIGKTDLNLQDLAVDFLVASAHKFHGPKGIGFAFVRKNLVLQPMLFGGEQEKGWRAGTESVHQIAGIAKAIEFSLENLEEERKVITALKDYCFQQLKASFSDATVNGSNTFYNILNVLLPFSPEKTAMILFNLDMKGIAVSRGSACQSGSVKPSHVLAEMLDDAELKKPSLRISFSHYNTKEEIDCMISALKEI